MGRPVGNSRRPIGLPKNPRFLVFSDTGNSRFPTPSPGLFPPPFSPQKKTHLLRLVFLGGGQGELAPTTTVPQTAVITTSLWPP